MSGIFSSVPQNFVLTSGANSALTWTNAVSVSSMNVSSLGASALSVSTLTTSTSINSSTLVTSSITANSVGYSTLSGSTINATLLNYSTIAGSSISSNVLTLSLTNTSTQNTQIYQVATTNPTTSYTVIQASHVSTGTTNNALALNPSGGNVGIGTTAPGAKLHVATDSAINTTPLSFVNTDGYGIYANSGGINARGNTLDFASRDFNGGSVVARNVMTLRPEGNVGIGTTAPGTTLDVVGTVRGSLFTTQSVAVYAGNSQNTFTLTVPYPATYLFTVTGNGAYVGGGGDNYAKAIIYIHIGSSGVLLTTVVQAQGVAINSYTPGTQALSYNIGTGSLGLQFGGMSNVSIIRLG